MGRLTRRGVQCGDGRRIISGSGIAAGARPEEPRSALTVEMLAAAAGASAEDGIWLDVIRKWTRSITTCCSTKLRWRKERDAEGYPA